MARRLATTVVVRHDGSHTVFTPDDEVPQWAAKLITNPKAWASEDEVEDNSTDSSEPAPEGDEQPTPPPKAGPGASVKAWTAYARSAGVDVPDGMARAEIVEALEKRGIPTE